MNKQFCWVEIDQKALLSNVQGFKKLIGSKVKLMAVVKGNAYGHGISEIAKIIKNKVDWFGVNNLDEAQILKKLGIKKPILILGYTPQERLSEVVQGRFRQVVYNRETVKELASLKKPCKIHLKIETGTQRQGLEGKELVNLAKYLEKTSSQIEGVYTQKIDIEGISTHFATLEEEENAFYKKQIRKFEKELDVLRKLGIDPPLKHTASTAAAILYPQTHFNMVRVGIGLYGLWPSELVKKIAQKKKIRFDLKPVLSWKTQVVQVKSVKKGETIGYGRTYMTKRNMKIAILPIGYFDGYDRGFSNIGRVLIRGQFANIVGRVMMNMIIADVANIKNVKVEDEVVLLGKQGKNEVTAEELAKKIDTINYEIVTRINPNLTRVIV